MKETEEFDFKSYIHGVKNRLRANNYSKLRKCSSRGKFKLLTGMFSNLDVEIKTIKSDEDVLIEKIQNLINSEDVSPLKELTDEKVFNSLTEQEKQRYMLNISDTYLRIKNMIAEKEKYVG